MTAATEAAPVDPEGRAVTRIDDGTSPGVQCGAVHDIAGRCTREMAHPGAHVARSTKIGHGSGGWLNKRPGEPDTTYVEVRRSDEFIRGAIGGAVAKLGLNDPGPSR